MPCTLLLLANPPQPGWLSGRRQLNRESHFFGSIRRNEHDFGNRMLSSRCIGRFEFFEPPRQIPTDHSFLRARFYRQRGLRCQSRSGTAGSGTMNVGPSVLLPSGETPTICRISGSRGGGKRASRSSSLRLRLLLIICLPVHFDFETTRITDLLSMIPEIF